MSKFPIADVLRLRAKEKMLQDLIVSTMNRSLRDKSWPITVQASQPHIFCIFTQS